MPAVIWPRSTSTVPPAGGSRYHAAVWLLGSYTYLTDLVDRAGVVNTGEGGPEVDLEALAAAVTALDADRAAWTAYRERTREPQDDAAHAAWEAAGPPRTPAAELLAGMSHTEVTRLRLLATLSDDRVPFCVGDLTGFDEDGRDLIADWCQILQAI